MIQNNPHEDARVIKLEASIAQIEEQLDLEEKIAAELDQQLAESKRAILALKHDREGTMNALVATRMKPIIVGS